MKRLTRYGIALAVALMLAAAVCASAEPPRYTVTWLGDLNGGAYSRASGINNSGQVVGHAYTSVSGYRAFLWQDGVMQDLGPRDDYYFTRGLAYGINDAGQVVGESGARAFLWDAENGMRDLGTLGTLGYSSRARAINNAGQVVGDSGGRAFLWDAENGMQSLGALYGGSSYAYGINDAGQVVGESFFHAFLWQDGVMQRLGTRDGCSIAYSINNAGQVVGESDSHASLWQDGVMQHLGDLGGGWSQAWDINDSGQVVGFTHTSGGDYNIFHAFLWQDGVMYDLNNYVDNLPTDLYLVSGKAINDHGQIVGYASWTLASNPGFSTAFLLTSVPEPSGLFVLLSGLTLIGGILCWKR